MNGTALMESSITGNVPVVQTQDGSNLTEMRGVVTYNIAPLSGPNLRDAYMRWQLPADQNGNPVHFVLGHIHAPFGLLTDEHRTYTRIQTNSSLNNFEMGGGVSANPWSNFHTDLVFFNDFQSGGSFTNQDLNWAGVLNFRWNPASLPFLIGLSGNYEYSIKQPQPYVSSLYAVFSLDRLTENQLSGSLSVERVDAKNWNNPQINMSQINQSLSQFFIPGADASYLKAISGSSSLGYATLAKYNLSHAWTLFYKLDYLALDRRASDDAFVRHGLGIETYLNSNLIMNARYERAAGMRPEISISDVSAAQNDFFAMLRLWL